MIMVAITMVVCHATVFNIQSVAQFYRELNGAGERLVVVIFKSRMDAYSRTTFSLIRDIEREYTDSMLVLQVDFERFRVIVRAYDVSGYLTVVLIRNNTEVKLGGLNSARYGLRSHILKELQEMGVQAAVAAARSNKP